ncbi:MAG: universal stress protein [Pseudonocardiales bacterium]|nr:MAG: universal stress protein [Pseudonocardiales bacterium]
MTTNDSPVVVGVDGSPGADAALAWALDEARSRQASARLVYGFGRDLTYGSMAIYGNLAVPELPHVKAIARRQLAAAATQAQTLAPDVVVTTHDYADDAVAALLEESEHASTVALGSRHLGAIGSAVLGSVGAAVSARAACPVVVVRGPAALPAESAAVVVGVAAREDSEATLAYGFDFARRRSLPLHAVLCWHLDLLAEMMWRSEPPAPARVETWLLEALAGWREKYPDVEVHSAVVREHPVAGLIAASNAQHLLVVGTRGRHALAGTLLGSVSQGVLHHATCPVAVVPSSAG